MKKRMVIGLLLAAGSLFSAKEWRVKSVDFEGNAAFEDRRLQGIMLMRPSTLFLPIAFKEPLFEDDLQALALFYRQRGWLDARVTGATVQRDSVRHVVRLSITVEEGEPTRVEGAAFMGNRFFSDSVLTRWTRLKPGDALDESAIEKSVLAMLTRYAGEGFIDARVSPDIRVSRETHRAVVDFQIHEGQRIRVGDIQFQGLLRTRERALRRELLFKEGDWMRYPQLLQSQRRLYLTGLFESVFVKPDSSDAAMAEAPVTDSAVRDVIVECRENPAAEINLSGGYGTEDKLRGRAEWSHHNLGGMGRRLSVSGRASFIHLGFEAGYTEPRLGHSFWKLDMRLSTRRREEPGFIVNQTGGSLSLGRVLGKKSRITLSYRQQVSRFSKVKTDPPDDLKPLVRGLKLSLARDTRDNLFDSRQGMYIQWDHELGGIDTEAIRGFYRTTAQWRVFIPLGSRLVLASSLEAGWMRSGDGLSAVPLDERFYAGGPASVRGFAYRKLGPQDDDGDPNGGRLKLVMNLLELRIPLGKTLGAALFADAGNVWSHSDDFHAREIRITPGAGLRVRTPLGVGRLDLAMNPRPRSGEKRFVWMFSVGQAF